MASAIRNNATLSRFEADVEGGIAFANYRLSGGTMFLLHSEVPVSRRGTGIGTAFVRGVLAEIRNLGLKVEPQCGFVRSVMAEHPEFNDLLR